MAPEQHGLAGTGLSIRAAPKISSGRPVRRQMLGNHLEKYHFLVARWTEQVPSWHAQGLAGESQSSDSLWGFALPGSWVHKLPKGAENRREIIVWGSF